MQQLKNIIEKNLKNNNTSIVFEQSDDVVEFNDDVTLVQAFYGDDLDRVIATTRALQYMLKSAPFPKDWKFVEAQLDGRPFHFQWLKTYGIDYISKTIPEESKLFCLKTPLWNIGAKIAINSKLLFLDSDVMFCNSDWLINVSKSLNENDAASFARYVYYAEETDNSIPSKLIATLGNQIAEKHDYTAQAHIGFGIAITRNCYDKIGKFKAFTTFHDDNWLWKQLLGTDLRSTMLGYTPYNPLNGMKCPTTKKIGVADNICCHICHGQLSKRNYLEKGLLTYIVDETPFQEVDYNPEMEFPKFKDNKQAAIIKKFLEEKPDDVVKFIADNDFIEHRQLSNEFTEEQPLIVLSFYDGDNGKVVNDHYQMFKKFMQVPFLYFCMTNIHVKGISCVPYDEHLCNKKFLQLQLFDLASQLYNQNKDKICNMNFLVCGINCFPVQAINLFPNKDPNTLKIAYNYEIHDDTAWIPDLMYFNCDLKCISNLFNKVVETQKMDFYRYPIDFIFNALSEIDINIEKNIKYCMIKFPSKYSTNDFAEYEKFMMIEE